MRAGDHVRITHNPNGGRVIVTTGILRHCTGVSVVLEPDEGERRHRRIEWRAILEVTRLVRPS